MPKRPSLRQRLQQPGGREALFTPPPSTPPAIPPEKKRSGSPSWDESNRRVTFYCPEDLLAAIEDEMRRSGRSKTRVITDAIRQHLG